MRIDSRLHASTARRSLILLIGALACSGDSTPSSPATPTAAPVIPIVVASANMPQAATVGSAFSYDATKNGTAFTGGSSAGLSYVVSFVPASSGLVATGGRITGVPMQPGIVTAIITATNASGAAAANEFPIVVFSSDLVAPTLPAVSFNYSDITSPLPAHFTVAEPGSRPGGPGAPALDEDNTPLTNPITDAGATLGRVLFYDRRLSANDRVACASCHEQQFAFSDTAQRSRGFRGGLTNRHSMALANARFYQRGRFFWDERAPTLEAQALQPIQDTVEMGMTLPALVTKLSVSAYYPTLFQAAFGTPDITNDRIARALAQFVRSLVSATSRFDRAFAGTTVPNFPAVLTAEERAGQQQFNISGCGRCHVTNAFNSDAQINNGLDATITDAGAGSGQFKAPSLKNVAVRPPYMHDGRFRSLEQVVDFYNAGVENNLSLDPRLRGANGQPLRLGLNATQRGQLVAFLRTLTDSAFLADPRFSSPFAR